MNVHLIEERTLITFRNYAYPRLEGRIQTLVGFEIPLEVVWESLVEVGMTHIFTHNITNVYFIPLIQALEQVTVDDVGRETILNRLERIVIKNESSNYDAANFARIDGGTLILDHVPNSNVDYVNERVQVVINAIENTPWATI